MTTPSPLDERYGRTPKAARRTMGIVVASGVAFVIVFVAWVVWGGLLEAPAQFEARDSAHEIVSEHEVRVQWEFNVTPGTPAKCAVQALNSTFGIVGWKVIDVPVSDKQTQVLTESVRTTELAVTGLIYQCWLT